MKLPYELTMLRRLPGRRKVRVLLPLITANWAHYPYVAVECGDAKHEQKTVVVHYRDALKAYPQLIDRLFQ